MTEYLIAVHTQGSVHIPAHAQGSWVCVVPGFSQIHPSRTYCFLKQLLSGEGLACGADAMDTVETVRIPASSAVPSSLCPILERETEPQKREVTKTKGRPSRLLSKQQMVKHSCFVLLFVNEVVWYFCLVEHFVFLFLFLLFFGY